MRSIFAKIIYELEKQHDLILITLVASDGSAPRKTGAQMLVGRDGRILGTIGGGAVEKRAEEMAVLLLAERHGCLHEFRLNEADSDDIGMICGGDVTALFTFIPADDPACMESVGKVLQTLSEQKSGFLLLSRDGSGLSLSDTEGDPDVFSLPLPVAERAILFGGGHIAAALAPLLESVGFRVTVFDDRAEFVTADRFPTAERLIAGNYSRIADHVTLTEDDYVVIMTNGHGFDLEVETQVLRGPFAYVGVIGSARKTASVNAKLRERGISEEALAKIHTPVGMKIKAVTPEEIAISIAGEMIFERALKREAAGIIIHGCPMH